MSWTIERDIAKHHMETFRAEILRSCRKKRTIFEDSASKRGSLYAQTKEIPRYQFGSSVEPFTGVLPPFAQLGREKEISRASTSYALVQPRELNRKLKNTCFPRACKEQQHGSDRCWAHRFVSMKQEDAVWALARVRSVVLRRSPVR